MSLIWLETNQDWSAVELSGSPTWRLMAEPELRAAAVAADQRTPEDILLCRSDTPGAQWAVLCRPNRCRVNGEPVATGLRCLCHRDELVLHGSSLRILYSTEAVASVTTHAGGAEPIQCPRCRGGIADGTAVVICPNCGVVYHQSADRPCWTYTDYCVCRHPTALDSGYTWPPEGF